VEQNTHVFQLFPWLVLPHEVTRGENVKKQRMEKRGEAEEAVEQLAS
jgi:hypothetical protein